MSSRYIVTLTAVVFSLLLFLPKSYSQVIEATGDATESSSQLVYYYDLFGPDNTNIQVTNVNDTQAVTVHVQIFRSFDTDNSGSTPPVICDERDFIDFLTPNDTHVYSLDIPNFYKNTGENEVTPGESTSIDLTTPIDTKGFVVITPVVSEADLSAISFEYLIGSSMDGSFHFRMNAMGRSAVDFATGDIVETGTPLDGTTNGFVLIQPEELIFDFAGNGGQVDVVGIAFKDVYGSPGLQGYAVEPGDATWTSFIFDYKEDPTSCGVRPVGCFLTLGLNDTYTQSNTLFSGSSPGDLLCGSSETPNQFEDLMGNINLSPQYAAMGWTRIFVSGLSGLENHLGVFTEFNYSGARWMNSNEAVLP